MNTAMDMSHITKTVSVDERMLILMDMKALISSADMGLLQANASLQ